MNKNSIRWSFITPITCTPLSAKVSDYFAVLYHLYRDNPIYREYVLHYAGTKFSVVDNGMWETSLSPNVYRYISDISNLDIDVVFTSEDVYGNLDVVLKSAKVIHNLLFKHFGSGNNIKVMGITKGRTLDEMVKNAKVLIDSELIDVVGISYSPDTKDELQLGTGIAVSKLTRKANKPLYANGLDMRILEEHKLDKFIDTFDYCDTTVFSRLLLGQKNRLDFNSVWSKELDITFSLLTNDIKNGRFSTLYKLVDKQFK